MVMMDPLTVVALASAYGASVLIVFVATVEIIEQWKAGR